MWSSRSAVRLRLGDYRRVLLSALRLVDDPVALLTITAPGRSVLLTDADFTEWNSTAAHRFALLDRAAKNRLRRAGLTVTPLFRVAQRQHRGADHLHIGLLARVFDRAGIEAYVAALRDLAPLHGFGFVDDPYHERHPKGPDGRPNRALPKRDMIFRDPQIAARYLCRYLTEESGQLVAMLRAGDHSFRPLWVRPSLTQASGVNCRRLRRSRHAWFLLHAFDMGSRPRLPIWWGDLRERLAVIRLTRPGGWIPPPTVPA